MLMMYLILKKKGMDSQKCVHRQVVAPNVHSFAIMRESMIISRRFSEHEDEETHVRWHLARPGFNGGQ